MRANSKQFVEPIGVSPRQAKEMLGCGSTHLYKLLKQGEILSYHDGSSRRILVSSLHAYVERQIKSEATTPNWSSTVKATQARMSRRRGSRAPAQAAKQECDRD